MNDKPIDEWTLVHAFAGALAGMFGVRTSVALGAAVAYEVVEQAIERTPEGQRVFGSSGPESLANAATDVVVFAAMHAIGLMLRGGRSAGK